MKLATLQDGEVHVWLADGDVGAYRQEEWVALLDAAEREAHGRLRGAARRARYAAGHAVLRCALSCYTEVAPSAWRFRRGAKGRPEVAAPALDSQLRFNLSYTDGLAVCAVASGEVGVDVERFNTSFDYQGVAERVFRGDELDELRALGPAEARRRFYQLWTLKEAYAKGLGVGLELAFQEVGFAVRPDGDFELRGLEGAGGGWRLASFALGPDYLLGIALGGVGPDGVAADEPLQLVCKRMSPAGPGATVDAERLRLSG